MIPGEAVLFDASQILFVRFVPVHVNKAVTFLIAVEPAEKIRKRPAAIADQINAIGDRLAAFRQMSIKVRYPIGVIDNIALLESIEFAEAILRDEYRKSVTAGDSPKPDPKSNRVDRPIPV